MVARVALEGQPHSCRSRRLPFLELPFAFPFAIFLKLRFLTLFTYNSLMMHACDAVLSTPGGPLTTQKARRLPFKSSFSLRQSW